MTGGTWDEGTPGCPGPQGSQDSLAGLARQSMAKMETEGPQEPRERQAGRAHQALWGCQVSVSPQPALEPQPTPLHASLSLDPSRAHEQQARTEPSRHPGGRNRSPLDRHATHPSAQETSLPRTSLWDPGRSLEEKQILKHEGRGGHWSEKVRPKDRTNVPGESKLHRGWGGFPSWSIIQMLPKQASS